MDPALIFEKAIYLADEINFNQEKIIDILLDYESYETALDEIKRSLKCLREIQKIKTCFRNEQVETISTFFPVNLPLYSLILFAVVPGFLGRKIFVRPPILMREALKRICKLLEINQIFPGIMIVETEKHIFLQGYVSTSDVVLFTGRYHNAIEVKKCCPDALFIYNGVGVNPILITPTANLKLAIKKTIEARTFNSGQDCAGPDTILVHSKVINKFLQGLITELKKIEIGDYHDKKVRIGRIIDPSQLDFVSKIFTKYRRHIIYGGSIDFKNSVIFPTIILTTLKEIQNYTEFFSPVFFISIYDKDQGLDLFFQKSEFLEYAMYSSVFGKSKYVNKIKNSIILKNLNVLDVEEGNKAYGGYGEKANFICYNDNFSYRPILIPKEIQKHLFRQNRNAGR